MSAYPRILILAAALLTAGCSTPEAQPGTVPVEQPASAPTSSAPAPAAKSPHAVGSEQTSASDSGEVKVTVLRMRQPFTPTVPGVLDRKGYVYAGVEAKLCVTRNDAELPVSVSWGPWSLSWESGVVVEAASSWSPDAWDEPLYPQDHVVREGRCVRGWIPFEVRANDRRPELVQYAPGEGEALEWKVAR